MKEEREARWGWLSIGMRLTEYLYSVFHTLIDLLTNTWDEKKTKKDNEMSLTQNTTLLEL